MKKPTLSPRLKLIADLVENSKVVADIGTDHAYLPSYLCLENRCETAIASDVRTGPLNRADSTILKYHLSDRIETRLGGGLETIELSDNVDTAIIAGMGGLLICDILEKSMDLVITMKHIILQPMTMAPELRKFIYNKNLGKVCEYIAVENQKIYNIISIRLDENTNSFERESQTELELFLGKNLIESRPKNYDVYIENQIRKLENLIASLKISETDKTKELLDTTTALLNEVLKYK